MIKEDLITHCTARLAMDKGAPSYLVYLKRGEYTLCTQSLLQKWLRKVHNLHIELLIDPPIVCNGDIEDVWYRAFVWQTGKKKPTPYHDVGCSTYEQILEEALQYALSKIQPKEEKE
jgi:hypothetical protein